MERFHYHVSNERILTYTTDYIDIQVLQSHLNKMMHLKLSIICLASEFTKVLSTLQRFPTITIAHSFLLTIQEGFIQYLLERDGCNQHQQLVSFVIQGHRVNITDKTMFYAFQFGNVIDATWKPDELAQCQDRVKKQKILNYQKAL